MREAGILLGVSSLPSRYGIGCFDRAAYEFVDALASAGQKLWQILPIGPTSYGDSPYQAFSTFAGNPYFISLEDLIERGWLTEEECMAAGLGEDPRSVDYGQLYEERRKLLRTAFSRSSLAGSEDYEAFVKKEAGWLEDYALFMALKDAHGGASWTEWEMPLRMRSEEALAEARDRYAEDISYYRFLQYLFSCEWSNILAYAHEKGVRIVGDIPIYVALDSVDVWASPELFQLDEARLPVEIAGCPPDAFAADGQLWGNPLYDWEAHEKTGFDWWIRRIRHCYETCDILRIDHFRGFDEYFAIPAGDKNAVGGRWKKGPGRSLFEAISGAIGEREIIAEDLGYVTEGVRQLIKDTGFAGMKLFEFAFDSRDTGQAKDYLPHNYPVNAAAYTGTHDNAPLKAWFSEILPEERKTVFSYLALPESEEAPVYAMVCATLRSVARIAVIPMQDWLGYGSESRMNTPSTSGENWKWRLLPGEFTEELQEKIRRATLLYGR